ncbi:hypothetical protein PEC311524_39380 [Pectobacterium carotovorum subsp. carotovorum]|nr:hypothetical protein PEC311524_39380 [Pectobacterium carotovorum subsp. carotovorum]
MGNPEKITFFVLLKVLVRKGGYVGKEERQENSHCRYLIAFLFIH